MPVIRLEQVSKIYKNSRRGVSATLQIDLTVRHGDFLFVTGPRGSGKSTLLSLMAGAIEPDRGRIWIGSGEIWAMDRADREDLLDCLGVVLADHALHDGETVFKNLASSNRLEYLKNRLFDQRRIEKALSLVGLAGSADRYPGDMTDSERARVLLAKAIWRSPPVLILDSLAERADDGTVWDMLHLLDALNRRGTTVVFSTAENRYTTTMNKRVVSLFDGHAGR